MFGDAITYTEGGKDYNALVISERGNPNHDSQMLSLVFVKEVIDSLTQAPKRLAGTGHQGDLVQWRIDVPHESAGESMAYWTVASVKMGKFKASSPDGGDLGMGTSTAPEPKPAKKPVTVKPKGAA